MIIRYPNERRIYFSSDLHFGHNKDFIYAVRGFESVEDMNQTIIENWNRTVSEDDIVYLLGDIMLGNSEENIEYLKQLNGNIHIIPGNHDTENRIKLYESCPNVVKVYDYATCIKVGKRIFYLSHYPTLTSNFDEKGPVNLYGHTHQQNNFYNGNPYMYHVGVDSHDCTPVSLKQILKGIQDNSL